MGRRQSTLDSFSGDIVAQPDEGDSPLREEGGFVSHPLIHERRLMAYPFQMSMAREALTKDTLLILPTGLGKTVIAAIVVAERMRISPLKVLFLAPTKPLVVQHARTFAAWFRTLPRAVFTGEVSKPLREGTWDAARVVFATPQLIVHDLLDGRYSLRDVGLIVFDEAHHTRGKYAYGKIAAVYEAQGPPGKLSLALTASPGDPNDIMQRLHLKALETRGRDDPDVQAYVQSITTTTVKVQLNADQQRVVQLLKEAARSEMVKLQRYGLLRKRKLDVTSVKDLVDARKHVWAMPGRRGMKFQALHRIGLAQHFLHSVELVEREGIAPFLEYVSKLTAEEKPKRQVKSFLEHPFMKDILEASENEIGKGREFSHPKIGELSALIEEELRNNPKAKIIVFAEYRDSVRAIVKVLEKTGITVRRFVGQANRSAADSGMKQHEQLSVIEAFKKGAFSVLVASRIAEEGLDIPQVDLVVEYDVLPSEMRTIQRRGRTGRTTAGRVVSLLTEGSKEERYRVRELKRASRSRRVLRRLSTL